MPYPYLPVLAGTPLFKGFTPAQLQDLLGLLHPATRSYAKAETLLMLGYQTSHIGIVLRGEIEAQKTNRSGQSFTVSRMGPGGVFGDILSGSNTKSPVTVHARTPCEILYLPNPLPRPMAPAPQHAGLFLQLQANLISVISDKYFALDRRVDLLLTKSLRQRVAAYLIAAAGERQCFTIPHTRSSLAAYLGCERSALSREISRMARAGLLQAKGAQFCIPSFAELEACL